MEPARMGLESDFRGKHTRKAGIWLLATCRDVNNRIETCGVLAMTGCHRCSLKDIIIPRGSCRRRKPQIMTAALRLLAPETGCRCSLTIPSQIGSWYSALSFELFCRAVRKHERSSISQDDD
jgi:hypothetical protein